MAPPAPPTGEGEYTEGTAAQTATVPAAEGGVQSWERPWTVGEIRKEANNWSLAGDAGLLQYLQEFSQRVISRTHEIGKEVDGLVHEAKLTGVRVNNVFNDFIMLANTQFVENRVYDEDVSHTNQEEERKPDQEEKTREQREAALIPKVTEALRYGTNVIDEAFERLDTNIGDSDSEDEEGGYRADPILEAKDPYVTRYLPLLIGSPGFLEDDNVGLVEDVSGGEETDHGSISESEAERSETESDSEVEERKRIKARRATRVSDDSDETESEDEEESDEDMFSTKHKKHVDDDSNDDGDGSEEATSSEEEKGDEEDTEKPGAPAGGGGRDFASELAARIGAAVPKPSPAAAADDDDDAEREVEEKPKQTDKKKTGKKVKKHKTKAKQVKADDEDLFSAPAGGEEDENTPFGKSGGLFTSSKGLFDDDEQEDSGGLFDDVEKPARKQSKKVVQESEEEEEEEEEEPVKDTRPRTASGKRLPKGAVPIFGDGDSGLFGSSIKEEDEAPAPRKPSKSKPAAAAASVGGGLFDEEEDEGGDLFAAVPSKKPQPKKEKTAKTTSAPKVSKASSDLFADQDEDEEGDLFMGQSAASTRKMSGPKAEEVKPKAKKTEKKLPAGAVSMFGGAPNPLAAAIKKQRPASDSEEDEEREDEEKSRSGSVKSSQSASSSSLRGSTDVKKTSRSGSASSNSLFADDIDEDLFSSKPKTDSSKASKPKTTAAASGLFLDDEEKQDDLFGAASKPTAKPTQDKKGDKAKPRSSSLFDDNLDDEEDMFSFKSKPKDSSGGKKKPVGGVALFGGADILKKKTETPAEEPVKATLEEEKPEVKPIPRKSTLSLFDEDDEDADLFGAAPKPKPAASTAKKEQSKPKAGGKSLFEDEDVLFGGASEEAPGVDLFSKQGPLGGSSKAEPATAAPSAKPSVKVGGATTKSSSTDLFDDDDDGLFDSKKDKPKEKVEVAGATTTESSDAGPPAAEEEAKPAAPPAITKPRKPAGAVSMFGGMDPSALLKKKKKPVEEEEDKPAEQEKKPEEKKKADPLFGDADDGKGRADIFTVVAPKPKPPAAAPKPAASQDEDKSEEDSKAKQEAPKPTRPKLAGAVSMFGGMDPGGWSGQKKMMPTRQISEDNEVPLPPDLPDVDQPAASSSAPGKKRPGKIGKLQGGLGINPAALLPGAAPPRAAENQLAVGFSEPPETTVLPSASKDRVRIITRRRPQSRKARHSAALSGVFDDFSPTMSPTSPTEPNPIAQIDGKDSSPPKTDTRSDLFGNDDILGDSSKSAPVLTEDKSGDKDLFSDGLFTKSGSTKPSDSVDGLFESSGKSEKKAPVAAADLFPSKSSSASGQAKKVTPVDNEEDLFAKTAKPSKPADKESKTDSSSKKEEKKAKVVDDDDIFADASINKKKESKKPPAEPSDDIFGDSSASKKPSQKPAPGNEEDIFAKSAPAEKRRPKKASVKDEALFKDETDIFADIPASKPKEPKKKKKTTEKKSIFKDDIDDIFADSSPVSTKSKKDTKKKTKDTGKPSADDVDIFEDPLGGAK